MSLPHEQSETTTVKPVQQSGFEDGASSPRSNAMVYRQNQIATQTSMNNSYGGKRKYRGGSSTMTVPQFSQTGPSVSTGSQTANASSQNVNTTNTQSIENSKCDSCIGDNSNTTLCQSSECNPQSGGGCGNESGLIGPNNSWGCMSGGKTRQRKKGLLRKKTKKLRNKNKVRKSSKKSSKSRKSRKSRNKNSKKYNKSKKTKKY
jgi:hypothetical protein